MKNACRSLLFIALLISHTVWATDLIVSPGGSGGSYASINGAVNAANSGDRIIVYPNPGGSSYAEGTITITKSIQILSGNEGAYYAVDGSVVITPATAGTSVTIIGMKLFTGGISASANAPSGARCVVNLINDSLAAGNINFGYSNYNLTLANSTIYGSISFEFGKLMGNSITSSNIAAIINFFSDASPNNTTDSVLIIGNKLNYYYGSNAYVPAIYCNSTTQYVVVMNNLLIGSGSSYPYAIQFNSLKSTGAGHNVFTNNTIRRSSSTWSYGVYIYGAYGNLDIENNIINDAGYNIYNYAGSSGALGIHYNYANSTNWYNFSNDGTNTTITNATFDADSRITALNSNAINGGNPDSAYADINLTRNDAGAYGGSFTLDNFFPNTANDWTRVFYVVAPRRVLLNGSINVKADGYDK